MAWQGLLEPTNRFASLPQFTSVMLSRLHLLNSIFRCTYCVVDLLFEDLKMHTLLLHRIFPDDAGYLTCILVTSDCVPHNLRKMERSKQAIAIRRARIARSDLIFTFSI